MRSNFVRIELLNNNEGTSFNNKKYTKGTFKAKQTFFRQHYKILIKNFAFDMNQKCVFFI